MVCDVYPATLAVRLQVRQPSASKPVRMRALRGVVAAACTVAVASVVPALAVSEHAHGRDTALPWLSVAHPANERAQIVDTAGRSVLLRGVNLVGVEDDVPAHPPGQVPDATPFWPIDPAAYDGGCPQNSHAMAEPAVCEVDAGAAEFAQSSSPDSGNDLAQIRALGLNVVRLPVSWSLLEPTPGRYDHTYLARVAQVVGWAREQGIYVLLDMHQDAYSRFTPETAAVPSSPLLEPTVETGDHADGAPPWAVVTDGEPAVAPNGTGELNAYVAAAFTNFWLNRVPVGAPQGAAPGPGLQDHYIGAVAALAGQFTDDPTVVGYELMNEPLPGYLPPVAFDQGYLFPFYRRAIDAVTGISDGVQCPSQTPYAAACGYRDLGIHDHRHLFFVEPMAARNLIDLAPGLSAPFTTYPNIVYAPHLYTHVFTVDTLLPGGAAGAYPPGYDFGLTTADTEARAIGAALWIGEYGNSNSTDDDVLRQETAAQDNALVGSALWQWKGNCGASSCDESGLWSMFYADPSPMPAQNLALIPSRVRYLSRVYPRATAGTLTALSYDPAMQAFTMTATGPRRVRPGDHAQETVVYVPTTVVGAVRVNGAATLDEVVRQPDGSRLAYVAPTGAGAYTVNVTV